MNQLSGPIKINKTVQRSQILEIANRIQSPSPCSRDHDLVKCRVLNDFSLKKYKNKACLFKNILKCHCQRQKKKHTFQFSIHLEYEWKAIQPNFVIHTRTNFFIKLWKLISNEAKTTRKVQLIKSFPTIISNWWPFF